jgi:hypothetical protein
MLTFQEEHEHAVRMLDEPCPFCHTKSAELWYTPDRNDLLPYQVRCRVCGACGPNCDCGEESAVPMWLGVFSSSPPSPPHHLIN